MWSSWHNERGNQLIIKVITHEIRSFYALKHSWRVNQKSYSSFTPPLKQANAWSIIKLILSLFWCFQYILLLILLFFDFLSLFSVDVSQAITNVRPIKKQLKRRERKSGDLKRERKNLRDIKVFDHHSWISTVHPLKVDNLAGQKLIYTHHSLRLSLAVRHDLPFFTARSVPIHSADSFSVSGTSATTQRNPLRCDYLLPSVGKKNLPKNDLPQGLECKNERM